MLQTTNSNTMVQWLALFHILADLGFMNFPSIPDKHWHTILQQSMSISLHVFYEFIQNHPIHAIWLNTWGRQNMATGLEATHKKSLTQHVVLVTKTLTYITEKNGGGWTIAYIHSY